MRRPRIELHKTEEIFAILQGSGIFYSIKVLPWFFSLGLLFVLLWPFWQKGWFGILVLALFILFTIYNIILNFSRWNYNTLIVTDERVIDLYQISWWKFQMSEVPLSQVKSAKLAKGNWLERLLNLQTVKIRTLKVVGFDMIIRAVPQADKFSELIEELQALGSEHKQDLK